MTTTLQNGSAIADDLLQRIGKTVGDKAEVSTIFGEPVERERVTVIPVGKARFAFGGGGGTGQREGNEGSGGGGGGAAVVSPIGYIELRDGMARFKRIRRPGDLLALVASASLFALAVRRVSATFKATAPRRRRASVVLYHPRSRRWRLRSRRPRGFRITPIA